MPAGGGGELIDYGVFALGPPDNIDPALNQTLDAYQIVNAMYDGLTDIDDSDPAGAVIVPHLAESYEASADGTVWTFQVREGLAFSDGEAILPSTFLRSWNRAATMGGQYAVLFTKIAGGQEVTDGTSESISGVVADDDAMTLTVTLVSADSAFDAIAGFQIFFPMPEGAVENPLDYENGLMVGNGPYMLESPRTDEEIVLVRNETWGGDFNGDTWATRPDRLVFRVSADSDTAYNALEAGEGDVARIPAGRTAEAQADWGTTTEDPYMGAYFFYFDNRDPEVGGPENVKFRQAISQAIDRDAINEAVFSGARIPSTGITPAGIPGFVEGLCEFCAYDLEAAQAAFDEWTAAGNSQEAPLKIQFGIGGVHEQVVAIIIENLAAIGIEAEGQGLDTTTYFDEMTAGACIFCRSGWIADYPAYENFMWDNFHSVNLDVGNNFGYQSEEFDRLVDEAIATVDPEQRNALFQEAERLLLNTDIGVVPINWYVGDYVFNQEKLAGFRQNSLGLILFEQVTIAG